MNRTLAAVMTSLALLVSACGGQVDRNATTGDSGSGTDSANVTFPDVDALAPTNADGPSAESSIDALAADFCGGNGAAMVVNGLDAVPVATGKALPLSCCHGGVLTFTTQAFAQPIAVLWRVQVGMGTDSFPATIDLAAPPDGWKVSLTVGCDPFLGSCTPVDSYSADLAGTLTVSRNATSQYDATLCLSLAENASNPHPVLHSLKLYAPHVTLDY